MHLSPAQRLESIAIFNDLSELSVNNKCTESSVIYFSSRSFGNNMELLQNPFMKSRFLKQKLKFIASIRTIRKNIKLLGWRKVRSSYCQIVSFNNQVKRYIFCCLCKLFSKKTTETLFLRIACSNSQKYNA